MRPLFLFFLFGFFHSFCQSSDAILSVAERQFQEHDFSNALESYQKAATSFQKSNEPVLYVKSNIQIARCYLATEQLERTISHVKNTLNYLNEVLPKEQSLNFECQLVLGEAYLKIGRNDLALETLQKTEASISGAQSLQAAECYNDLGVVYWNNMNTEIARGYHEKALHIRQALLPKNDVQIANSYLNLGLIYQESDFLKAVINFNNALSIYKNTLGDDNGQVALCYNNLAFVNSSQNNFAEALNYLDKTMGIWERKYQDDHPNKAFTLSNKGRILEARGDYYQALQMQEEALKMYLRLYGEKHPEVANTYYLIGSIQTKQQAYHQALESFQESIYANLFTQTYSSLYDLPVLNEYYSADILLSSLQNKAQAMEALHFEKSLKPKDIKGALDTYLKCDDLISEIRHLRLSESDKIRIGSIASEVYDNGIRIALYLSDKTFQPTRYQEIAFNLSERSKSAVLLEAIGDSKAKSFTGIPDHLIAYEDSLKTEISWIERQLSSTSEEQNVDVLKNTLFSIKQLYRDFISKLEADYPNYFKLKYQRSNVTPTDIQSLLSPYAATISYFIGNQSIYIFTITKNSFKTEVKPKDEAFLKYAKGLRNAIKYRITSNFQNYSMALYQQLIPSLPSTIKQLSIIPDGILGTLPFESFISEYDANGSPRYLLEQYTISYDYASTLYYDRLQMNESTTQGILLAAPVSFDNNEVAMNKLPGSEQEVREIRYLFLSGKDEPKVLLKNQASEASIKSSGLSDYKYLHFATHGIVNESKPELSRIFLSPDKKEDGSLYSGEIYTLNINADLITLSACETGLGKVEKGEGIIGLSRSLMYAGAKNLIVSLWQVSDASTAQLMIEFYRQHLLHSRNMNFTSDLQKAKLSLLHSKDYQDPYFWAPFILIGK